MAWAGGWVCARHKEECCAEDEEEEGEDDDDDDEEEKKEERSEGHGIGREVVRGKGKRGREKRSLEDAATEDPDGVAEDSEDHDLEAGRQSGVGIQVASRKGPGRTVPTALPPPMLPTPQTANLTPADVRLTCSESNSVASEVMETACAEGEMEGEVTAGPEGEVSHAVPFCEGVVGYVSGK